MNRVHVVASPKHALIAVACWIAFGLAGAVAADRPVTVVDIIGMTTVSDPADGTVARFSPDARHFALIVQRGNLANNSVEGSILVFASDSVFGGERGHIVTQFASSSNRPAISRLRWINSTTLMFLAEKPHQLPQLYTYEISTKALRQLTNERTAITVYDSTSSGSTIAYSAETRRSDPRVGWRRSHGFVVNSDSPVDVMLGNWDEPNREQSTDLFIRRTGRGSAVRVNQSAVGNCEDEFVSVSPDGKYVVRSCDVLQADKHWLAYSEYDVHYAVEHNSNLLRQCMLVDAATGVMRPLFAAPIPYAPCEVTWSRDSRAAFVPDTYLPLDVSNPNERLRRASNRGVAYVDLQSGSVTAVVLYDALKLGAHDFVEVDHYDPSSQTVTLSQIDVLNPTPVAFKRTKSEWVRVPASSKPITYRDAAVGNVSPYGQLAITLEQSMNQPPHVIATSSNTHQRSIIFNPNPQFASLQFGTEQQVRWLSKDGTMWTGGLYYPVGYVAGKRYPLIIQTHGFSDNLFVIDGPFSTAFAAQALAGLGFVVLQMGDGPGESTYDATTRWGPAIDASWEGAIDTFARKGLIDRNKVGIIGFSATCFEVEYFLTHSTYPVAAASITDGVDYSYLQFLTWADRGSFQEVNGGLPFGKGLDSWRARAPGFNADRVRAPLRITAIGSYSVLGEWEIYAALRRLHKPTELVYLPDGVHELVKPWERLNSLEGNVEWFRFWLKDEETANPLDSTEYARWRAMREQP